MLYRVIFLACFVGIDLSASGPNQLRQDSDPLLSNSRLPSFDQACFKQFSWVRDPSSFVGSSLSTSSSSLQAANSAHALVPPRVLDVGDKKILPNKLGHLQAGASKDDKSNKKTTVG